MRYVSLSFLLLILGSALLSGSMLTHGHSWGGDFSSYIMQTIALSSGRVAEFVTNNAFIVGHSTNVLGPVAYPWGTPLLLAPIYLLAGFNLVAFKYLNLISYLFFLVTLWFGFRSRHTQGGGLFLVALFAFNPALLLAQNHIGSDLPFLFLSTASLLWMLRLIGDEKPLISSRWDGLLLALIMAAAFFTRTNGILLPIVFVGTLLWKRRWKESLLPSGTFILLYLFWRLLLPERSFSHASLLGDVSISQTLKQVGYYLQVPHVFFYGLSENMARAIYWLSIPFLLIGCAVSWRRNIPIIWYGLLTFGLFSLWPSSQGHRFLYPLLPFYLHFVLLGIEWSVGRLSARRFRVSVAAAGMILGLFVLGSFLVQVQGDIKIEKTMAQRSGPFAPPAQELFGFVKETTDPKDVIAFFKPRVMYLLTGRRALGLENLSELSQVQYVVYHVPYTRSDQLQKEDLVKVVRQGALNQIFRNREFVVFRRNEAVK